MTTETRVSKKNYSTHETGLNTFMLHYSLHALTVQFAPHECEVGVGVNRYNYLFSHSRSQQVTDTDLHLALI